MAGAILGIWITHFALNDLASAIDSGEALPGLYHFVLCWPLILVPFIPASTSRLTVQTAIYVFNSGTFVFLFLILGMMFDLIFRTRRTATAGGNHG